MKKLLSRALIFANVIGLSINSSSWAMDTQNPPVSNEEMKKYYEKYKEYTTEKYYKNADENCKKIAEKSDVDFIYDFIKLQVDKTYKGNMTFEEYGKMLRSRETEMYHALMKELYNYDFAQDRFLYYGKDLNFFQQGKYILKSAALYSVTGIGTCKFISNWIYCSLAGKYDAPPKIIFCKHKTTKRNHVVILLNDRILDGVKVADSLVLAKYIDLVKQGIIEDKSDAAKELVNLSNTWGSEIAACIYIAKGYGFSDEFVRNYVRKKGAKAFLEIPKEHFKDFLYQEAKWFKFGGKFINKGPTLNLY